MAHILTTPSAPPLIDLSQHQQIEYWTRTLSCNELVLRIAVAAVGAYAADVQRYVQSRASWRKGRPASPTPYPIR
jgi:hypothetical protein